MEKGSRLLVLGVTNCEKVNTWGTLMQDKGCSGTVCHAESSGACHLSGSREIQTNQETLELSPVIRNHCAFPGKEGQGREFYFSLFFKLPSA